jgi:hypothetical protein
MGYSAFFKLNDNGAIWKIRRRDFDDFWVNEVWKEFLGNKMATEGSFNDEFFQSIIGKEIQKGSLILSCCVFGTKEEVATWNERIRSIQLVFREEESRMWNQVLNFKWKRKPFYHGSLLEFLQM